MSLGRGPGEAGLRRSMEDRRVWAGVPDARCAPQNCLFDTCNCEKSEDCMCAALSSYVRAQPVRAAQRLADGVCSECPAADAPQIPPPSRAGLRSTEPTAPGPCLGAIGPGCPPALA